MESEYNKYLKIISIDRIPTDSRSGSVGILNAFKNSHENLPTPTRGVDWLRSAEAGRRLADQGQG